jgi:hypothetical protein
MDSILVEILPLIEELTQSDCDSYLSRTFGCDFDLPPLILDFSCLKKIRRFLTEYTSDDLSGATICRLAAIIYCNIFDNISMDGIYMLLLYASSDLFQGNFYLVKFS